MVGSFSNRMITIQAQRPGPREAGIATTALSPGSLPRFVRRHHTDKSARQIHGWGWQPLSQFASYARVDGSPARSPERPPNPIYGLTSRFLTKSIGLSRR